MTKLPYNNLTELLLNVVQRRPGLYLGLNYISKLPNFILGYQFGHDLRHPEKEDFYFGEQGFLSWYKQKYTPRERSFWHDYFLEEANNDEIQALNLYFDRLDENYSWYKSEGIKK